MTTKISVTFQLFHKCVDNVYICQMQPSTSTQSKIIRSGTVRINSSITINLTKLNVTLRLQHYGLAFPT